MANDINMGRFYTTTPDGRWQVLGEPSHMTVTTMNVPDYEWRIDSNTIDALSQAYTATLKLDYSFMTNTAFSVGSISEHKVLSMCFTLLDAVGLWSGLCCSSATDGRTHYYAMDDNGKAVVELVRSKLNTIAHSFPPDAVEEICDDMIETWKRGVPALDVLA